MFTPIDDPQFTLWLWAVDNIVGGLAFIHIPMEMLGWFRSWWRASLGVVLVFLTFWMFIFWCGLHHLVMVYTTYGHHPIIPAQLIVDTLMGAFALMAAVVLAKNRTRIRNRVERLK